MAALPILTGGRRAETAVWTTQTTISVVRYSRRRTETWRLTKKGSFLSSKFPRNVTRTTTLRVLNDKICDRRTNTWTLTNTARSWLQHPTSREDPTSQCDNLTTRVHFARRFSKVRECLMFTCRFTAKLIRSRANLVEKFAAIVMSLSFIWFMRLINWTVSHSRKISWYFWQFGFSNLADVD